MTLIIILSITITFAVIFSLNKLIYRNFKKEIPQVVYIILAIVAAIATLASWVNNFYIVITSLSDPLTTMLLFRIIGIVVPPIGALLGFI